VNYGIFLRDLELGGEFTFQGTVKIQVEIKEATQDIVLNAHQLSVHDAEIFLQAKCSDCPERFAISEADALQRRRREKSPLMRSLSGSR
jgi:aminopeptidase N